jgi:signal peptidase II
MRLNGNRQMAAICAGVFALDQLTKQIVLRVLGTEESVDVFPGFFKLVHWQNRGAAWSLFSTMDGSNYVLAAVSLVAFGALIKFRHHFGAETRTGRIALGLVMGGILGNLCDRLFIHHVVDFLRFYLHSRTGQEVGFPAFNVADSAICIGVGLMFIQAWIAESSSRPTKSK